MARTQDASAFESRSSLVGCPLPHTTAPEVLRVLSRILVGHTHVNAVVVSATCARPDVTSGTTSGCTPTARTAPRSACRANGTSWPGSNGRTRSPGTRTRPCSAPRWSPGCCLLGTLFSSASTSASASREIRSLSSSARGLWSTAAIITPAVCIQGATTASISGGFHAAAKSCQHATSVPWTRLRACDPSDTTRNYNHGRCRFRHPLQLLPAASDRRADRQWLATSLSLRRYLRGRARPEDVATRAAPTASERAQGVVPK